LNERDAVKRAQCANAAIFPVSAKRCKTLIIMP
jgi:hypothetical protein